ncbi:hypothetical protein DV096_13950 [Bradymonadaceae bacterium TMQ3]|nr:hypothetical protein DV096_13950 [Bradymonadaceae bacterium TMQ3]TXC75154.1 hypothetical protein FRC91_13820 [Bradymonadales bacterium TMQ1]
MNRIQLVGVDGSNPLGFLAALGLLRLVPNAKLGFSEDGSFRAFIDGFDRGPAELATLIADDAKGAESEAAPWRLTYIKAATKKTAPKKVADLKPPPKDFKVFLATGLNAWLKGEEDAAAYGAAYGTDVAVDNKGNTKPTAFHFTAAQQAFLETLEIIRGSVNRKWVETSLFHGYGEREGKNLRWAPGAERNWALMASNPSTDGTCVDAPLEWLAFRGLPLLPSFPVGDRIITTGVSGRGKNMTFMWPLWSIPTSRQTIRSVLQLDWNGDVRERLARGVFALCSSNIRRTSQGYGNFGPSSVIC